MNQLIKFVRDFATEDDGAQIIEYALIIALLSVFLVLALRNGGINITGFVARVNTCLTTGACT